MQTIIDMIDKWCSKNDPVLCGLLLLAAAFILSFFYQTFWGTWKSRK